MNVLFDVSNEPKISTQTGKKRKNTANKWQEFPSGLSLGGGKNLNFGVGKILTRSWKEIKYSWIARVLVPNILEIRYFFQEYCHT